MAEVQDILGIANYQGQAYAGGNVAVSEKIELNPISQLASYTYQRNKDQWERDNLKRDEAVKYIAEATALDPIGLLSEQNDPLIAEKKELDAYTEDPDYLNPDKNPKQFAEYMRKYSALKDKIARANQNNLNAKLWQNDIDATTDPEEKKLKQERYDLAKKEFFKDGAANVLQTGKVFAAPNEIKKTDYTVPLVDYTEVKGAVASGDYITTTGRKILNMGLGESNAIAVEMGLKAPKYQYDNKLTKEDNRKQEIDYNLALKNSKTKGLYDIIDVFNQYKDDPNNKIAQGVKSQVEEFNKSVDAYNEIVRNLDSEGSNRQGLLPANKINLVDGLQPNELIRIQSHSKGVQDSVEVDKKYTQAQLNRDELAEQKAARIAEDNYKLKALVQANRQFYAGLNNKDDKDIPPQGKNTSAYIKIAQTFSDATKGFTKKAMRVNELSVAEIAAINPAFVKTVNGNTIINEAVLTNDVWFTFDKNGNIFVENQKDKEGKLNKTYQPSVIDANGIGQIQTTYKDRKDEISIYDVRPEFRFNIGENITTNSSSKRTDEFGVPY